jgi:hypothetical protein
MNVDFVPGTAAYPAACFCGEYRQYVRGNLTVNGRPVRHLLADPTGGVRPLLSRPAPGDPADNFLEDGMPAAIAPFKVNMFYGHRGASYGNGEPGTGSHRPGRAGTGPWEDDLMPGNPPVFVNDHWVLATLEDAGGGLVRCHASIAVGRDEDLQAADVEVRVLVGGQPLAVAESPPDGPLPSMTINGTTAFAQYVFENPGDPVPETIDVVLGGQTASFDVSPPVG